MSIIAQTEDVKPLYISLAELEKSDAHETGPALECPNHKMIFAVMGEYERLDYHRGYVTETAWGCPICGVWLAELTDDDFAGWECAA